MEYKCEHCDSEFSTKGSLRTHLSKRPKKCLQASEKADEQETKVADADVHEEILNKFLEEGKKQLTGEKTGDVQKMFLEGSYSTLDLNALVISAGEAQKKLEAKYQEEVANINTMLSSFKRKWGERKSDMIFINEGHDVPFDELERQRDLLDCKVKAFDTLLIKNGSDGHVLSKLERFLKKELVKKLQSELK